MISTTWKVIKNAKLRFDERKASQVLCYTGETFTVYYKKLDILAGVCPLPAYGYPSDK